jgi:heme oxygenase
VEAVSATGSLRLPRTEQSARVRRVPDEEPWAPGPGTVPLSVLLAEGTEQTRQQAEGSLFLQTLFHDRWEGGVYGQFVRAQHYVSYLRQLHFLYAAYEAVLPSVMETPLTSLLLMPELRRADALEEDLVYFCGETRTDAFACDEVRQHAERLREVAAHAPHLLVAHAYARCMLDVFSGPARARCVAEAFELEEGRGTRFHPTLTALELAAFRVRLHSRLDGLELDADEAQEIIQEARMAFRLHALVCAELARGAPGITVPCGARAARAPCPSR